MGDNAGSQKTRESIQVRDALTVMETYLERAKNVLQNVTDEFFNYSPDDKTGLLSIQIFFNAYRVKADIAYDYMHRAGEKLAEATSLMDCTEDSHENTN